MKNIRNYMYCFKIYRRKRFKEARTFYNSELVRTKHEYEQKQFEQLSKNENRNTKMWWKLLKEVTKDGGRMESIPPIKHNAEYITKYKDKAAMFNNYFLSISSVDEWMRLMSG